MRAAARVTAAVLGLVSLGACATVDLDPVERPVGTGQPCRDGAASGLVGKAASPDLGAEVMRLTGARIFQWVPPDTAVTMDFRPDRVRVSYDRAMRVTSVRCG